MRLLAEPASLIRKTVGGAVTDQSGYYTITLPHGRQTLLIKGVGMQDTRRRVILYSGGKLDVRMQEKVTQLKEVNVSAQKVANVRSTEMGVTKLDIRSIKQIPTAFGEADVLRVVLTLMYIFAGNDTIAELRNWVI